MQSGRQGSEPPLGRVRSQSCSDSRVAKPPPSSTIGTRGRGAEDCAIMREMTRALFLLIALTCGCRSERASQGSERGDCFPNATCNDGLTCLSNVCVQLPSTEAAEISAPPGDSLPEGVAIQVAGEQVRTAAPRARPAEPGADPSTRATADGVASPAFGTAGRAHRPAAVEDPFGAASRTREPATIREPAAIENPFGQ